MSARAEAVQSSVPKPVPPRRVPKPICVPSGEPDSPVLPALVAGRHAARRRPTRSLSHLSLLLNTLATVQLVWVYLVRTSGALRLSAFEAGAERTPFQYRLLLALPLRWAHHSTLLRQAAFHLGHVRGWLPDPITPEGLLQACVDLLCVATSGCVARRIYRAASHTGSLTPFVYPLHLALFAGTYVLLSSHALRFVYDLPSLAFFSLGLYLLYFRRHAAWFAALFVVATLNRETTLLLLPLFALTQCLPQDATAGDESPHAAPSAPQRTYATTATDWRRLFAPATLRVILPLAGFWIAWHLWVAHHFAGNPSAAGPRLMLNLGLLLCPLSWPQVAGACGFLCPLVLFGRDRMSDPTLRLWVLLLPLWFAFMLVFGLLIEPRIFGELIPLVACASALIAEDAILHRAATP